MDDTDIQSCQQCGHQLPKGIPPGLCPQCLLAGTVDLTSTVTEPLFPDDKPGEIPQPFGSYEMIEEIAHGGMGVVYKAWHKGLRSIVAVKMLLPGAGTNAELVHQFRKEGIYGAALRHRHIVPVHDAAIHEGRPYLVMDYIDGMNLAEFLRTEPVPIHEAVRFVEKIARAVHHAHDSNVLHRDLKPSNILIDRKREPYVADFGVARSLDDSSITITGQVVGSVNYMPPEQASPEFGKVSRRSDVYGLGAILYHCLTGRPPFQAESRVATLQMLLSTEPVAPHLLNHSVKPDAETICLKCLEKDPARRYQTAAEVADELQRFLEDRPIHARPVTRAEKLVRWCRRNPPLASAIGAAALFLIAGLIFSTWQANLARREARSARLRHYVGDMMLADNDIQENNFASARERLRAHLPKKGWPDLRGWEWRYLWKLCNPESGPSFVTPDPIHALAQSPDGALVAAAIDGAVHIFDLARNHLVTNLTAGASGVSQKTVAWSPDGPSLAVIRNNRVLLWRVDSWQHSELARTNTAPLHAIAFAADGRTLLGSGPAGLEAWDSAAGNPIDPPIRFRGACRQLALSADGRWLALVATNSLVAWDLGRGELVLSNSTNARDIHALALSSHGMLVAGDRNGSARVWNLPALQQSGSTSAAGQPLRGGSRDPVFDAAFSPDGALLALACSDQVIRVYATSNWTGINTMKGHQSEVWSVAFSHDGEKLISGAKDGVARIRDPMAPQTSTLSAPGVAAGLLPLGFTPDSREVVAVSARREELQFWNAAHHTLAHTLVLKTNIASDFVEITPDSRIAVIQSSNYAIHLLDARTGVHLGVLDLEKEGLQSAVPWQCSPDSRLVAVSTKRERGGEMSQATELFDLNTTRRVAILDGLRPLRFSPSGRYLAGRNSSRQVVVWDLGRMRSRSFPVSRGEIPAASISPDDRLLAVANENVVHLWNMETGRPDRTLHGHRASVGKILFSRDGLTLFSTSTDRTVKLWNVATGQLMLSLPHSEDTWETALSPDDTTLAVGGLFPRTTTPAKLWFAPSLKDIDAALEERSRR